PRSPSSCACAVLHPPQPRSTLFPYTTRFRSPTALRQSTGRTMRPMLSTFLTTPIGVNVRNTSFLGRSEGTPKDKTLSLLRHHARSEEHTSELQSRENLVCRLLLEKKTDNVTR